MFRTIAVVSLSVVLAACVRDAGPQVARVAPPPSAPIPVRAPTPPAPRSVTAPAALAASVASLVRGFDGRVGVAVRSIDQGWTVDSNGDLRLPQQSVSKLWVAMTVLDLRDSGRLQLDDPVTVRREDLTLFHQPIAALVKGEDGYQTTVGGLLQRALTMSDNTANDRLLRFVGGPSAVRAFLQRKGLDNIRFGPGERLLQAQTAGLTWKPDFARGNAFAQARAKLPTLDRIAAFERYISDPPDGAAPIAIANALARLKRGDLLTKASSEYLIGTMESSHTGKQRMRGAVPPGWSFGHKTGTGQDLGRRTAGYNDVGLLIAPDGRSYAIAVMIGDTPKSIPERQALMQAVVASVVANHG
ncbi:serine hydrolase [Sphingomonas sp. HMP6]|uniref:serine hydrolase n=1 Tax=Sphingomonas sp. HMP6 TaxID=1517551 RepID=UPI001596D317|nr:serine hydrolase [Sphingomonas sp. HMP6]BCA60027.1 beta-lactamase [Sphingomonas sp. HMP6]